MTIQEQVIQLVRETWGPTDAELYVEAQWRAADEYYRNLTRAVWERCSEAH